MGHTRRLLTIAILSLVLSSDIRAGAPEAAAAAAAVILDSLVVRVYDNAGLLGTERSRAIWRADSILSRADIDVEWVDCPARRFGARRRCAVFLRHARSWSSD